LELINKDLRAVLEKQKYRLVGGHSAIKLCTWTKKSIRDQGVCYKQQFYGIECHRCLQMTPAVSWCTHKCLFCWRNVEQTLGAELPGAGVDEPSEIIDGAIRLQRKLLEGYAGVPEKVNQKKYKEAQDPNQAAISLSGEPTIYPKIGELVAEFKRRRFSTFLVTNGTLPKRLEQMDTLPTQLYLSLVAPNREVYKNVCNPSHPGNWDRIQETLALFPSLDARKAVRITLVKGMNMVSPEEYAKMLSFAQPDYVEVKAYMYVGGSRMRLTLDNMPSFAEVQGFATDLSGATGYRIKDYKRDSRVVLLSRK
jgi:tRNA wybutosine-synthesizing protein 1